MNTAGAGVNNIGVRKFSLLLLTIALQEVPLVCVLEAEDVVSAERQMLCKTPFNLQPHLAASVGTAAGSWATVR